MLQFILVRLWSDGRVQKLTTSPNVSQNYVEQVCETLFDFCDVMSIEQQGQIETFIYKSAKKYNLISSICIMA